jgi:hypothetical protein
VLRADKIDCAQKPAQPWFFVAFAPKKGKLCLLFFAVWIGKKQVFTF